MDLFFFFIDQQAANNNFNFTVTHLFQSITLNVTKGGTGLLEKFDADQRTLAPDGNAIRAMRTSERVP
jgi:hypothetical protein